MKAGFNLFRIGLGIGLGVAILAPHSSQANVNLNAGFLVRDAHLWSPSNVATSPANEPAGAPNGAASSQTEPAFTTSGLAAAPNEPAPAPNQGPNHGSNAAWDAGVYDTLPYRILYPAGYDPARLYPLVIFLHGSDESGSDNQVQVSNGAELFASPDYQRDFPAFVVAPQCPDTDSWGGYLYDNKPSASETRVIGLVKSLSSVLPIDTKRVYLTGLSMGGIGAWDMIARYPGIFAAALPIAGAADSTTAKQLVQFPIWAFHGADDVIVDPIDDRNMYHLMTSMGGKEIYTEYPGVGHNAWAQTYANPNVIRWLFSQSR